MSAERRQRTVQDFPDERRAMPDRRREDPDVVGTRLLINLNADENVGEESSPFPPTAPSVDITPWLAIGLALAGVLWGMYSCG